MSLRARRDPYRRTGNANAVAAGIDLSQVGMVSERELNWLRHLAAENGDSFDAYLKRKEEQRRALSAARTARWSDTKEAKHEEFIHSQEAAMEEAEKRREELDAFFAEEEKEAHRNRLAQLELLLLKDDPRGRNIQHAIMLDKAMKERKEQIEFNKMLSKDTLEEERRDLQEKQLKAWGEEAEERRKLLLQREKNMEEKATNLEAVLYQIEQRKQQRTDEKKLRAFLEQEALEEKLENEEEERIRKAKEMENGLWNRNNARKAVTKHQKLDEKLKQHELDEAKRIKEEEFLTSLRKVVEEKRRKKQEEFELRKKDTLDKFRREKTQPSPTYRTQDVFEQKGVNFANAMAAEDDERVAQIRENLRMAKNFEEDDHRKAEASASGFLDYEEEVRHLEEMRRLPDQARAEEAEAVARKRAEAERIARIQRMQAAEKKKHERLLLEIERENAARTQAALLEDDERYLKYLESQLPSDMDPYLREKALKMS